MRRFIVGTFVLLLPSASASPPDNSVDWAVRMMRIEGAAADVRRAAENIEVSAKKISNNGYLSSFTQLETELEQLNRMVISARLALDVAKQDAALR
jgi:hypothetical protein